MKNRFFGVLIFIMLTLASGNAQQIDTLTIYSDKMKMNVNNLLILPADYNQRSNLRYPVVYLLHGHGGNYTTWLSTIRKDLPDIATQYNFIIVCPDAKNSWYWDSPVDPKSSYDTYISNELIGYVDSHYNTINSSRGRAITGSSMGGHGALWLVINHPDIFGVAGSTSGGVDFRPFPKSWNISKLLGNYADNKERWGRYTVTDNIQKLRDKHVSLIIDCGQDDFFLGVNDALHRKLLSLQIPHVYSTSSGGHNTQYWSKSIVHHFDFFRKFFNSN